MFATCVRIRRRSFATAQSIAKLKPPLCSAESKLPIGAKIPFSTKCSEWVIYAEPVTILSRVVFCWGPTHLMQGLGLGIIGGGVGCKITCRNGTHLKRGEHVFGRCSLHMFDSKASWIINVSNTNNVAIATQCCYSNTNKGRVVSNSSQ